MKLGITIFGIVLAMLGLSMMWIGIPYLQQLGYGNFLHNSTNPYSVQLGNTILTYSIVAIIGIVLLLVGIAVSAYGVLSSVKVKQ